MKPTNLGPMIMEREDGKLIDIRFNLEYGSAAWQEEVDYYVMTTPSDERHRNITKAMCPNLDENVENKTPQIENQETALLKLKSSLVNQTIKYLKQLKGNCLLSGDDSCLENTWEEICVQVQQEESFYWDAYILTIEQTLETNLFELSAEDKQLLWLNTEEGFDWQIAKAAGTADEEIPPVMEEDIVQGLKPDLLYRAGDYENRNITRFINGEDEDEDEYDAEEEDECGDDDDEIEEENEDKESSEVAKAGLPSKIEGGFEVLVDDNYNYMNEDERYSAGKFDTYEKAVEMAKSIVDHFLEHTYKPGTNSTDLYDGYTGFGEDPFIVGDLSKEVQEETLARANAIIEEMKSRENTPGITFEEKIKPIDLPVSKERFSAWDYAEARCKEICRKEDEAAAALIPRFDMWPWDLLDTDDVLREIILHRDLGENERASVYAFLQAVNQFPKTMPDCKDKYYLRLANDKTSFSINLFPDRFEMVTWGRFAEVKWVIHFYGSGRGDIRIGDIKSAFAEMCAAVSDANFILKV
jgi:hypothetical protein